MGSEYLLQDETQAYVDFYFRLSPSTPLFIFGDSYPTRLVQENIKSEEPLFSPSKIP